MAQRASRLLRKVPGLYTARPIDRRSGGALTRRAITFGAVPVLLIGGVGAATLPTVMSDGIKLSAGSEINLVGHGNGHGRGMGQWGAFGYAKKGWTSTQILSHFYGGTSAGKVDNSTVTVILTDQSAVNVYADAGMKVGDKTVAPGQAVRLSGGTATITSGCGGGAVDSVPAQQVSPINPAPGRPAAEIIKFCGSNDAYRGSIGTNGGGVTNIVNIDDYVKGVVPKESPAKWADEGGAEALKAQSVAARTYALASIDLGKKIDDTQNSQVYGGVGFEDPRTNAAVDATAGQILLQNGKAAFTEFSSSSGGYSAGGRFPAVIDEGDDIAPYHNWNATVGAGTVGSAFGVGSLNSFEVIESNGLGPDGGRVIKVRVSGSGGTVEASGQDARTKLGLKSPWFSVQGQTSKPKIVAPEGGVGPTTPGPIGPQTPGLPQIPGVTNPTQSGASGLDLTAVLKLATDAIGGKYGSLGGAEGVLGQVLGPVLSTPDGKGAFQQFLNGNIYFSQLTGAQALGGVSLASFISQGAEAIMGFPTKDSLPTLLGPVAETLIAAFQNGTLAIDPKTGAATRQ